MLVTRTVLITSTKWHLQNHIIHWRAGTMTWWRLCHVRCRWTHPITWVVNRVVNHTKHYYTMDHAELYTATPNWDIPSTNGTYFKCVSVNCQRWAAFGSDRQSLPWMFRHGNIFGWMGTSTVGLEHWKCSKQQENHDPFHRWMFRQILAKNYYTTSLFFWVSPAFQLFTARVTFAVDVRPRCSMVMLHTQGFFWNFDIFWAFFGWSWRLTVAISCQLLQQADTSFLRQFLKMFSLVNFVFRDRTRSVPSFVIQEVCWFWHTQGRISNVF